MRWRRFHAGPPGFMLVRRATNVFARGRSRCRMPPRFGIQSVARFPSQFENIWKLPARACQIDCPLKGRGTMTKVVRNAKHVPGCPP